MLPNQIGSLIRAVLPISTFVALLTARGFSPDVAQLVVDSAITLAVTAGMAAWGWWTNRPKQVVAQAAALPLNTMSKAEVAPLVDKLDQRKTGLV